jgi:protein-L-isoaspartate(D-aspartate) O-methyltransferase
MNQTTRIQLPTAHCPLARALRRHRIQWVLVMIPSDELQNRAVSQPEAAAGPVLPLPRPNERSGHQSDPPAYRRARQQMVETQLRGRGISDLRVLEVMGRVPRHAFVPLLFQHKAYADRPLPIGEGQTISQPYIVALMSEIARPTPQSRALEIGTGCGYQTAVLAELCQEVYSIEIRQALADKAAGRLAELGYENVAVRYGDGSQGWPERAPFDVILVAAAPPQVPPRLVEQLAPRGRLVIPVGSASQALMLLEKQADGAVRQEIITAVAFVPMTGEVQQEVQQSATAEESAE